MSKAEEKYLGFCGLDCSLCPAYIATVNKDDFLKKKPPESGQKDTGKPAEIGQR